MTKEGYPTPKAHNYIQTVTMTAAPGKRDQLREALQSILVPTWAEPGCLLFHVHEDVNNPDALVLYEIFEDEAALEVHRATEHVAAIAGRLPELLAAPSVRVVLNFVPAPS